MRSLRRNRERIVARAEDKEATERLLCRLEAGYLRSAAASTQELRRYRDAFDADVPMVMVRRGKRSESGGS